MAGGLRYGWWPGHGRDHRGRGCGDGDDSAFYGAFVKAAAAKEAEAVLAAGHQGSARSLFLKASALYAAAYHPIYGTPVDPRLVEAFDKQMAVFQRGMKLSPVPVHPIGIPYEGTEMAAYFVPTTGRETEVRPLLILNNGYDATITDLYMEFTAAEGAGEHTEFRNRSLLNLRVLDWLDETLSTQA